MDIVNIKQKTGKINNFLAFNFAVVNGHAELDWEWKFLAVVMSSLRQHA